PDHKSGNEQDLADHQKHSRGAAWEKRPSHFVAPVRLWQVSDDVWSNAQSLTHAEIAAVRGPAARRAARDADRRAPLRLEPARRPGVGLVGKAAECIGGPLQNVALL